MQNQDLNPTQEIMAFAVKELTKDFTPEQQQEFSKRCFDTVVVERYHKLAEYPKMNIQVSIQ